MKSGFWTAQRPGWRHAIFVAAVLFVLRAWSFVTPIIDVDEPQFAGFAHALMDGGVPYVASLDTKPLGVYWFFAAVFSLFGRYNMEAVHAATAVWVGLTAFFCYGIARRVYTSNAGFWAALFYAVFSTAFVPKFIGTSIAVLMMLPLTMSIYMLIRWEESAKRLFVLFSGLLWGLACLFKYQAGINLVAVGFYLLLFRPLLFSRNSREVRLAEYAIFVSGGAAVGLLFAFYLYLAGAWDAFVFWSLKGSAAYVHKGSAQTSLLASFPLRGGAFILSTLLVWYLSARAIAAAARGMLKEPGAARPAEWIVIIWLAFSFFAVLAGGKLYGHYFYQVLPQLCVLSGGCAFAFLSRPSRGPGRRSRAATAFFAAALIVPAIGFFSARLFADRIYSAVGEESPSSYARASEYIRERTDPNDKIFVWGFATSVYHYSQRPSASRFLWSDWLTGRVSGTRSAKDPGFETTEFIVPGSWDMFFDDMERNRPVYFVDTSPGNHHDYGKYPVSKYPKLLEFLEKNYALEASIDGIDLYRRIRP
ncbi:MAG TPA: glycosyltransferase family 39 protein [bacterium]|nr:glycosyltransferase family 39 protein [bacterium]